MKRQVGDLFHRVVRALSAKQMPGLDDVSALAEAYHLCLSAKVTTIDEALGQVLKRHRWEELILLGASMMPGDAPWEKAQEFAERWDRYFSSTWARVRGDPNYEESDPIRAIFLEALRLRDRTLKDRSIYNRMTATRVIEKF